MGNFGLIGFDVGPTLASWLEKNDPFTYEAIIAADHEFFSDDGVPPCHRARWHGPYDTRGTIFVAEQLP